MSYIPTGITTEEREDALLALRRREVELREREFTEKQRTRLWTYLTTFATVGLPILTFLGFKEYFAARRRRKAKI